MREVESRVQSGLQSDLHTTNDFLELGDYVVKLLAAADSDMADPGPPNRASLVAVPAMPPQCEPPQCEPPRREAPKPVPERSDGGQLPSDRRTEASWVSPGDGTSGQEPQTGEEVDDIEAYMAEWLRRVRGETNDSNNSNNSNDSNNPSRTAGDSTGCDNGQATPEGQASANDRHRGWSTSPIAGQSNGRSLRVAHRGQLDDAAEPLVGGLPQSLPRERSVAAERPAEIQALRDVANASTHRAIRCSLRSQFWRECVSKGTVSLVSAVMGASLWKLSPSWDSVLCLGAAACLAISGLWSLWILRDWLRLRSRRSR